MRNYLGEREYQTWAGWKKAAKEAGAVRIEGDKDIANAFAADGFGVGEWDGEKGSIYERKPRRNPVNRDDLYVEYLRPMQFEEPFMMGGNKYEYVRARYSDGREDIGVYSYRGDITYGYEAFNRMMGISRSADTDPSILEMRERIEMRRRTGGRRKNPSRRMSANEKYYVYTNVDGNEDGNSIGGMSLSDAKELACRSSLRIDNAGGTLDDSVAQVLQVSNGNHVWSCDADTAKVYLKTRKNPLESGADIPDAKLTNRRAARMT